MIVIVIIMVVFGTIGAIMAANRNRSAFGWFIVCALFPLLGIIILAAVGKAQSDGIRVIYREHHDDARYLPEAEPIRSRPEYDLDKWNALAEFDPDIRAACEKLKPYGASATKRFASAYMALGDKTMIASMVDRIIEQSTGPVKSTEEVKASFLAEVAGHEFERRSELLRTSEAIIEKIRSEGMALYDDAVAACELYFGPLEEYHGQALVEYRDGRREFWNGGVASRAPSDA